MSEYLREHGTRRTPQSEQADPAQIQNDAGGYVFAVDDLSRLRRFLILGSEAGSYYAGGRELTKRNVAAVRSLLQADGPAVVAEVVAVSEAGSAPSNEPALFALACAISLGDQATRRAAAEALPRVARIGTHLYHFVAYAETMRGWGRTLRWAVGNWYDRNPEQLALQAVKYRQRDGWSHRDVFRLAHPDFSTPEGRALAHFVSGNPSTGGPEAEAPPVLVEAYLRAQKARTPAETAELVREYDLPREALQTEHLAGPDVWRALLERGMPTTALVRNLATMTRLGVLDGSYRQTVTAALADGDQIRRARVHPMTLLVAQRTYASGRGGRGRNEWRPIPDVTDALDDAFYLAFDNVEATGKRILLGVDVSGSMNHAGVAGSPLTAREAAAAMALVTLHAEPNVSVVGFTNRMHAVSFSRRQRLDDALARMPWTSEGTDCAVPIDAAIADLAQGALFDAIVLYTDNETWSGRGHVHQAIRDYRDRSGIQTRLVACGLVATEFTVCDPSDPLSLNVVGFDASAPQVVSAFAAARL